MRKKSLFNRSILGGQRQYNGEDQGGGGANTDAPSIESTLSDVFAGKANSDVIIPEPDASIDDEGNAKLDDKGQPIVKEVVDTAGKGTPSADATATDSNWFLAEMKTRLSSAEKPWEIPTEITTGKKADGTDMTPAEKFDAILKNIYDNTTFDDDDDDFIKSYKSEKAAAGDKFDEQAFITKQNDRVNILKADNPTFMTKWLQSQKNEDGTPKHSDDQIQDYVSKLNSIELDEKVATLKSQIQEHNKQYSQKSNEEITKQREQQLQEWDTKRQAEIAKVINEVKTNVKEIGGIPVTESDIQEFQPVFERMTSLNKETGNLYMDDYLQSSNQNVFNMLYLMHKVDSGGMANYFSNYKEDVKQQLLKRASITPNISHGSEQVGAGTLPTSKSFH